MDKPKSLVVGFIVILIVAAAVTYFLYQRRVGSVEITSLPSPTPSPQSGFPTDDILGETASPSPLAINSQPATGPSFTYYLIMFAAIPVGLYLARFKKRI